MVYVIQGFFFFSVFFWDLNSQKLGRGSTTWTMSPFLFAITYFFGGILNS
jgi:hypothetical protein